MKHPIFVLVVGVSLAASLALTADHLSNSMDLSRPYMPSRQEWLELSAFKVIKDSTDMWQGRIGFSVRVVETERTVFVTLTSANGEEAITSSAMANYTETVASAVKSLLGRYEWAQGLKVHVQFL